MNTRVICVIYEKKGDILVEGTLSTNYTFFVGRLIKYNSSRNKMRFLYFNILSFLEYNICLI